jgi:hypothetical protein
VSSDSFSLRKARSQDLSFCRKTLRTVATESLRCRGKLQQTTERRPRLQIPRIKEIAPKQPKKRRKNTLLQKPLCAPTSQSSRVQKTQRQKSTNSVYVQGVEKQKTEAAPQNKYKKQRQEEQAYISAAAAAAEKATTTQQRTDDDKDANDGRYAQRRSAIARAPLSLSLSLARHDDGNDDEQRR